MSERFERLWSLPNNLYTIDSPIVISAGVLLKDTQTAKIVAQFKFQNISGKVIKALKLSLHTFDITGISLHNIDDYQYLDLSIGNGCFFGADKAIIVLDSNCRSISLHKVEVIFADQSTWFQEGNKFTPLPSPKKLQAELSAELVKQYQIASTSSAKFVPQVENDLWICTCGHINRGTACSNCHCTEEKVFSSYDISKLTKDMEARIEKERADQDVVDRSKAKIAKRNKIVITVIASTLLFVGVFFCGKLLLDRVIIPNQMCNEASALIEEGKYEEAYSIILSLGGYSLSDDLESKRKQLWHEALYNMAIQEFENGNYDDAMHNFSLINGYKDSIAKEKECAKAAGDRAIENKHYQSAVEWYEKAESTSDINNAKYLYIQSNKNSTDVNTYYYLEDLKRISYKDTVLIYEELYQIHFELLINESANDHSTNHTEFDYSIELEDLYVHFRITGGTPGQEIYIQQVEQSNTYDFVRVHNEGTFKCNGEWHTFRQRRVMTYGDTSFQTTITFYMGEYFYNVVLESQTITFFEIQ